MICIPAVRASQLMSGDLAQGLMLMLHERIIHLACNTRDVTHGYQHAMQAWQWQHDLVAGRERPLQGVQSVRDSQNGSHQPSNATNSLLSRIWLALRHCCIRT